MGHFILILLFGSKNSSKSLLYFAQLNANTLFLKFSIIMSKFKSFIIVQIALTKY